MYAAVHIFIFSFQSLHRGNFIYFSLVSQNWITEQRHHFAHKEPYSQSRGFSSSHVWMWELDHKEGWIPKNLYSQIIKLEKTLESPLNCKEIKPVNSKENQLWIVIGKTDAKAEVPILWPPDANKLTHWKIPWCWERLKARGEGDNRGWDGWMATPTHGIWVWASSGR